VIWSEDVHLPGQELEAVRVWVAVVVVVEEEEEVVVMVVVVVVEVEAVAVQLLSTRFLDMSLF